MLLKVNSSLPKPLEGEIQNQLLKDYKNGNYQLKEYLVTHNLRLVQSIVCRFYTSSENKEDLFQIGVIGLMKAIDSYDINHTASFFTYSSRCINNEILMYLRKQGRWEREKSYNNILCSDVDGNELSFEELLVSSEQDPLDKCMETEHKVELNEKLSKLSLEKQLALKLYFGFINETLFSQQEIGEILKLSQSVVSRIIKVGLKELKLKVINGERGINLNNHEKNSQLTYEKLTTILNGYFSEEESIIILMALGYVDNQYYSFRKLSQIFDIDYDKVEGIVLSEITFLRKNKKEKKLHR